MSIIALVDVVEANCYFNDSEFRKPCCTKIRKKYSPVFKRLTV